MDDFIKEFDEQLNMAMKSQNGDLSRINIDESPEERKVRNLFWLIFSKTKFPHVKVKKYFSDFFQKKMFGLGLEKFEIFWVRFPF